MGVVVNGDRLVFHNMVFGQTHPATKSFVQQTMMAPTHMLTQTGMAFIDHAKQIYETIQNSDAVRVAKAARRRLETMWSGNHIAELRTIGEWQNAPQVMQRFIMACPEIRTLYHKQLCDGYSDTYTDHQPGVIGAEHYDYRRVMDTMDIAGDCGEYDYRCINYDDPNPHDLDPTLVDYSFDATLTYHDRLAIVNTWDNIRAHLAAGLTDDPVSKFNTKL